MPLMMHKGKPINLITDPLQSLNHRKPKLKLPQILQCNNELRQRLLLPIILIPLLNLIDHAKGHLIIIITIISNILTRRPKHKLIVRQDELTRHVQVLLHFELDDFLLVQDDDLPRQDIVFVEFELFEAVFALDAVVALVDVGDRLLLDLDRHLLELVFLGTQFLGSYFLADGFVLQPREAYHLALLLFVGGQSEIHFLNKGWVCTRDTLVLTTDSTMG
jgi:hypothetical protein